MRDVVFIVFICAVISDEVWCKAPVITVPHPQQFIRYPSYPQELVVQEGHSFHLRCQHTAHVNFSLPAYVISPFQAEVEWKVNVSGKYNPKKSSYVSDLTVTNPSHQQTGYIYCKNEYALSNYDLENTDKVYIYVQGDSKHIFTYDDIHNSILYPTQYKPLVIPCRPTSPDVDIDLELADGDIRISGSDDQFDPRSGFTVKHMDLHHDGTFECNATRRRDGATQSFTGVIRVMPVKDYVESPLINSTQFQFGAGDSITLQCIVIVDIDTYFRLYWLLPDTVKLDGGVRITNHSTTVTNALDSNGGNKRVGSVLVTLNPARPSDSGTYKCVVDDHNNNSASTSKHVTIFPGGTNFINLTQQPDI